MDTRVRVAARAIAPLIAALALGACAASAGPGWTYVPPQHTPVAAAGSSAAPGASGGTAAASPGSATSPGTSGTPVGGSAAGSAAPAASGAAAGNVIDLVETATLQITDPSGKQVTNIVVGKGQTYTFRITNTAGFIHNFYVGKVSDLAAANIASLTGVPDFSSGTKEFTYTFTDTSVQLGFGCMVPGHYQAGMRGTFTVQ